MGLESFISGSGIASKALDYVDTAVQYFNQKKLNRQAQSDTQENMQLQKDLNLQQVSDSYAASVRGMRKAGINPALAVGGVNVAQGVSSAPGNAGTAAKPENSLPAALEAGVALAQQKGQIENLDASTQLQKAETDKVKAESEGQRIKNARNKTEDSLIGQNLPIMLSEIKESTDSPFILGFIEQFEESLTAGDLNLGVLDSFSRLFFDFSQRERDRELDYISKEMDKLVLSKQYENGAAEALADMPKVTRLQIYRNIALMDAQIGQLKAETSLTEDKRAAIRANISKLAQEVQSLLHHDVPAMWHAGDISGLLASVGYDAVKAGASGLGFAAGARALGSGSVAGKGVTKPELSPSKISTPLKGLTSTGHKPPDVGRVLSDDVVKRSLYNSFKDKSKVDWLWSEYRKSRSRGINATNSSFNEFLLNRGIGERR